LAFSAIYPKLNQPPTCTDGKKNGTETGIDCGGSCVAACIDQVSPISVLWSRAFKVIPGRYNAVAYIVNHNKNTAVQKISYRFRFADANNVYIGKREGSTLIPPSGNFAVFEPGIDVGNSTPVYTTFEFTETPQWLQVPIEKANKLKILISNLQLLNETISPKLSASIKNNSTYVIPNLNIVVILYDKSGNALSVSNTYLSQLGPLQSSDISFTWPQPFSGAVVQEELIPMYDIFSVRQ